jgi:protein tyrosine phosphatase
MIAPTIVLDSQLGSLSNVDTFTLSHMPSLVNSATTNQDNKQIETKVDYNAVDNLKKLMNLEIWQILRNYFRELPLTSPNKQTLSTKHDRYSNINLYLFTNENNELDESKYLKLNNGNIFHASFIPTTFNFIENSTQNLPIIATQGPIDSYEYIQNFWEIVFDHVKIICMTTLSYENGRVKCANYFPNLINEVRIYGNYKIECVDITTHKGFIDRKLVVNNMAKSSSKIIHHLHYVDWEDMCAPNIIDLHNYLNQLYMYENDNTTNGHIMIHCSAGVGRTGTTIICYELFRLIKCISNWPLNLSPETLIHAIKNAREYRMQLVINEEQFNSILKYFEFLLKNQVIKIVPSGTTNTLELPSIIGLSKSAPTPTIK